MRRRSTLLPFLGAIALAACEGAVAPQRQAAYDFDLSGTGLVFHWTPDRLPVRYWVAPDAGVVRDFTTEGIRRWTQQFLYGEFRGVLVADSTAADVLVWVEPSAPPAGQPTDDPPVLGACEGVTSNDTTETGNPPALEGPFTVIVTWDPRYPDVDVVNCLERVTTHEIGHTLGLFGHSPNAFDLMNGTPQVASPSPADRATVEVLYRTPPSVLPPEVPR
jgi:hypothetical protein